MDFTEALAVRQYVRKGIPVRPTHLREAQRILRAIEGACGEKQTWVPEPLSHAQRDRINAVLAYRLALACRKLDDWMVAPKMGIASLAGVST